jgi:translocation and assembly module TamB
MSAFPTPPLHDEPPLPPVRRRARWKKVVAWIAGGTAIMIVLVVIAIVILLHSERFHRYVLGVAEQKATAALGSQVQARDFRLSWSGISPRIDLYDVVVAGAPPYTSPPLLTVAHIELAVKITSLLHRTWYVDYVGVDRPVVHYFGDARGVDNLPQTKSSQTNQQSRVNLFQLGIRHAVLDRGEVWYNNRKSSLEADLHDVSLQSAFDPARTRYAGTLGYREGNLRLGTYRPMAHDFQARFAVTPREFTLERAVLSSGPSQIVLSGTVRNFAHPTVNANYSATVDSGQFRRILNNPSLPIGVLRAAGTLDYRARPNTPMLDAVVLNGTVSSAVLTLATPSFRSDIRDLSARYAVANGNAEVRDIHARLLGGELTATLTMRDITGNSRSHLQAALRGVSLADAASMMKSAALKNVAVTGAASATADATWGETLSDLVARTDATLSATLRPAAGGNAVPLNGVIHARYSAPSKEVTLVNSYLRSQENSLTLNGTVSNRSALQVSLESSNLHELETAAALFRTPPAPLGLYGGASFAGSVTGSTSAPHVTGQLAANNLKVKGSSWKLLHAGVDLSPSSAALRNGQLQPADRGNISFSVQTALSQWSFTNTSPFQVALKVSNVNVSNLTRAAGSAAPVTGTLAATVNASGTALSPAGSGAIRLTSAVVSKQPIQALNVDFQGTGEQVNARLAVQIPKSGNAHAVVTYFPRQQGYEGTLQAVGINLAQLEAVKSKNLGLSGTLNLTASGRGTLQNPGLQATLEVPTLAVQGQTVSGLTLQATVANHVANFTLDSQVLDTYARARGTVQLVGQYFANATLDTGAIPLAPLVAAYAPSQAGNIAGQTELHATLRGPLKNFAQVQAHASIPTLQLAYGNAVHLAAVRPIQMDYTNGVLQIQRAEIRGTGTSLAFQGAIPVKSAAPASLLLVGNVDLQIAQLLNPDITSAGQVQFNINSYGAAANPNVEGQVRIVNASFATGSLPIGLQNANGVLTLTRDRLDITQFTGTVGGGTVTASGSVVYRPALDFHLALAGNGIRMLYPGGIRVGADTNLRLAGTPQASILAGGVQLTQLQFTPDFDLMNFMSQLGGGAAVPAPTGGFTSNLKLNVGVQSTAGINLVSRTMSLDGAANLRLTGTADQPAVLGRVVLTGGDLIFMGNRYVLQGGTIDFINPSRTEPVVNVSVNTSVDQYNIQVHFWGPAEHLHTSYSSDPSLPPSDIINLIAFGKTSEASAANPTPPGNLGAESLIASQVSSQITGRVSKIAGISQLSIDPVLGGSGQTPGARIAIQQRVTSKIYVDFASDVTSTQHQAIQVEYHVSPKLSFSGSRNQNGGFGFQTSIHKAW